MREPRPHERELIEQGLPMDSTVETALQEASRVLHFVTRHAGVVLTPRPQDVFIQQIEFVRLRENRVLAILVGQNGEVRNKLLTVEFAVTPDELVRMGNYLSELLAKVPLEEVQKHIQKEMEQERALYDQMVTKALKLGYAATELHNIDHVLIEGANSFVEVPDFADVERMRAIFRALGEKGKLLQLLDRVQREREMQIFIGAESEFSSTGDVSVIASPYSSQGQVLGAVGVIGPTRMNYQRVVPLVNFTAHILSKILDRE
jgi:heat-inducible transcriptional repressor